MSVSIVTKALLVMAATPTRIEEMGDGPSARDAAEADTGRYATVNSRRSPVARTTAGNKRWGGGPAGRRNDLDSLVPDPIARRALDNGVEKARIRTSLQRHGPFLVHYCLVRVAGTRQMP